MFSRIKRIKQKKNGLIKVQYDKEKNILIDGIDLKKNYNKNEKSYFIVV